MDPPQKRLERERNLYDARGNPGRRLARAAATATTPSALTSLACMAGETLVECGQCGTTLPEPPDIPAERRKPCSECGSTRRTIYGSASLTVGVSLGASAAAAEAVVEKLEDAGFSVQWLRLSEGGAWMVRVFDRQGGWLDGSIADDPQDAILAVSERLLPPSDASE